MMSSKPKPPPWIPPGISSQQKIKKHQKPARKSKKEDVPVRKSPERTFVLERKEAEKEEEPDIMAVSSNSSAGKIDPNICIFSQKEMKLLYTQFSSFKNSYFSSHKLIDFQSIEDTCIKELLSEVGSSLKDMNYLFEDLEYGIFMLENTLNEDQKMQDYSLVLKNKEKLLSKLFQLYEKVIIIFQTTFEKQDYKKLSELQVSLNRKLQVAEKKCISQEAVIKDLERRLSIYQSKTNAMESYKTNLESAKSELEKQLLYKESQIKYLSNELQNSSRKQTIPDNEDLIKAMEIMKSKAHSEKSALKEALKFKKTQSEEIKEKYQKLVQESREKDEMMFDIAAQRDQLKVQLTVLHNQTIHQKNQIEEIKLQNLKLQNASHKKEISELRNIPEEKSSLLDNTLKVKKILEETDRSKIAGLEEELKNIKLQLSTLQQKKQEETARLLHRTKELQESLDLKSAKCERLQHCVQSLKSLKLAAFYGSS